MNGTKSTSFALSLTSFPAFVVCGSGGFGALIVTVECAGTRLLIVAALLLFESWTVNPISELFVIVIEPPGRNTYPNGCRS